MEHELVAWPTGGSNSMVSATVGRAMSTLLGARPKKLEDAISRLHSAAETSSIVSMEESLRILQTFVRDAAEREEYLDDVIVPMTEHSLKHRESKQCNQAIILLNWLFKDETIFQALVTNLAGIITRKEDRYINLGWCILVRGIVEYEIKMKLFENNGIKEKYCSLLKILSSCITHLLSIVCNGSTLQGQFELPTRLSLAAADCVLALTTALAKKNLQSRGSDDRLNNLALEASSENTLKPKSISSEVSDDVEMKLLLWDHLDGLIILLQKLSAWSRKSRPLHAKGLERVLAWLRDTKGHYMLVQNKAGSQTLKAGVMLLASCWKYYGVLMHLEDYTFFQHYKEQLDQYLSGIQFYAGHPEEHAENKDSGKETLKFFLNCLSLLLGHFDAKRFEKVMSEDGLRISQILISQLRSADEDVVDGAVSILKEFIFRPRNTQSETSEMDDVLPLLLHLLDERDGTARAVVVLIAEYCSRSTDDHCLEEVLKRLASGDVLQRRNAIDVLSELFSITSDPVNICGKQDISQQLLNCLGDEEMVIRAQASKLIALMDPSLVFPALVALAYSFDEAAQSTARKTLATILECHNKFEVLSMLLDSLSNFFRSQDLQEASGVSGKGVSKLDADIVLRLILRWSDSVDWKLLIVPLIDKLFAEPSNAIIVRLLSYMSEHLADAADVVFHRLLVHANQQKDGNREYGIDSRTLEHYLFDRLCPLLIIRLLPLRVFDDLKCSLVYGEHLKEDSGVSDISAAESVAGMLLNRAFNKFELEDVRKLAAELCGRIHSKVLFPIIASQLAHAVSGKDVGKIKTCLFSICTSLVVREKDSNLDPSVIKIRNGIETVLLWPSLDGDDVSKAQHGCIDCLALMICAEVRAADTFKGLTLKKSNLVESSSQDAATRISVLNYVMNHITQNKNEFICSPKMSNLDCMPEGSYSLSFRLCMANVLISACQKIPETGKKPFASRILPRLLQSVPMIESSEIRAACIHIVFSAVYHLKSAVLPFTSDLLRVSLKVLREGTEKEKLAGAKLMASLMAGEETILESIAEGLLEARTVLSSVCLSDPSLEVREVTKKLLACLT